MDKELKKKLSTYAQIFKVAQETNKKEADVVMYIVEFLKDALKYDVFKEISKEFQIKDKYCDIAIKIDGKVQILIEVKQPGVKLSSKHIQQAENYAMRNGTEWAILTNGCEWHLYHMQVSDEGIESSVVFKTDLLSSFEANPDEVVSKFSLLHRNNFIKGSLDKHWEKINLLNPNSLLRAVFTDSVLRTVARELNRGEKVRVQIDEIARELKNVLDKNILADLADLNLKRKRRRRRWHQKELKEKTSPDQLKVNELKASSETSEN